MISIQNIICNVLLEEFKQLRAEIAGRSQAQLQLIALNVTVLGFVGGLFLSQAADPRILFVIPVLSPFLGMLYLDHAVAIGDIGRFIQNKLKPKIAEVVGVNDLPDYERRVRMLEERYLLRLLLLGFPTLFIFGILPLLALIVPFFILHRMEIEAGFWLLASPGILILILYLWYWSRFVFSSKKVWQE